VLGISSDSESSHQEFQQKHNLPYTLLSDQQKKVRQLFGVPGNLFGLIPGRVTYVIGLDGKVAGVFNSQTNPLGHIKEAKKVVQRLLTA
jgi:peroxiredoxin Q/BCP